MIWVQLQRICQSILPNEMVFFANQAMTFFHEQPKQTNFHKETNVTEKTLHKREKRYKSYFTCLASLASIVLGYQKFDSKLTKRTKMNIFCIFLLVSPQQQQQPP